MGVQHQYFGPTRVMSRIVPWYVPSVGGVIDAAVNFETMLDKRYARRGYRSVHKMRRLSSRIIFRLREKSKPTAR